MKFTFSILAALATAGVAGIAGCSSDNEKSDPQDAASTGGKGTGGRSATGGAADGSGGKGSGGADPVACGIDAGVEPCLTCLATTCCEAAQKCFADPTCADAYGPYRTCVAEQADDVSACFSAFTRAVVTDHEPLLRCIALGGCEVCGAPAPL
jgi:hypothetical protein